MNVGSEHPGPLGASISSEAALVPDAPAASRRSVVPPVSRRRAQISADVGCGFAQLADAGAILLSGAAAIAAYVSGVQGNIVEHERYWLAVGLATVVFPFVHRRVGGYTVPRLSQ